MTYQERLNARLVVHLRPDYRWAIAARFHQRSDAESYVQLLRQRSSGALFWVVFDSANRPLLYSARAITATLKFNAEVRQT